MRSYSGTFYVLIIFLLISPVRANDVNTGGQKGVVRTLSAYTFGKTGINVGGSYRVATEMEYVKGKDGKGGITSANGKSLSRENPFLMTGDIYCAYGILSFLDAGIDLPVYYDVTGWGEKKSGVGDLNLSLKMANPFQKENAFFSHAYYFKVIFPTGVSNAGFFPRHSYFLDDSVGNYAFSADAFFFNPAMAWTFDFSRIVKDVQLQLHVNFGGVIAEKKRNSAVIAAVGVEYTPVPLLTLFAEVAGESRVKFYNQVFDIHTINNDPLWITPGVKFNIPSGFYALLAADIGISDNSSDLYVNWKRQGYTYSTKATPAYGVHFSFGVNGILIKPDSDDDGFYDDDDNCPQAAEDRDGFQDSDGCPDLDNDNDGYSDAKDRCPDSAGPDGGCPVYDSDKDGIDNKVDRCPSEAEDPDGFQDNDGCPDADNDADGVVDPKDNCPEKAEDLDGYDDGDGCPDLDNDGDGVSDAEDKCPGVRGLPENSGCPKTKEISRGKLVLSGVTFQTGKALLTSNSYTILDQVYESLVEWPEVKLEIQGHTDNLGNDKANLTLSQQRADEVKMYLINKGINSSRLRSVGYGEEFPIADNHTPQGREKNRRVELRRID
jgi:outer membrane protein OmpA-like peptidoglycan-associated protein